MTIVDGRKIAHEILISLKARQRPQKFLGAVIVGDDPASLNFLKQKEKTAKELGVDFRLYRLSPELQNDAVREEVGKIARHKTCGGVIVQLPLPAHLDPHYVVNAIPAVKDVDVLSERALGAFYVERNPVMPPAVGTVETILHAFDFELAASSVAVIGVGFLIGKPTAVWLMKRARELYLLHQGSDFSAIKNADLVISGAGHAGVLTPQMLKEGACVIDFGYDGGKGDFDTAGFATGNPDTTTGWYTPTPGGTGPVLVATLFENFYALCGL